MGNALRFLYGGFFKPQSDEPDSLGPHGVTISTVGVSALAHDLSQFDITSQVPQGLSQHVVSSKKAQTKPPPKTPEDAAKLITQTLKNHEKADVEGHLAFYGLPLPHTLVEVETSSTPAYQPQHWKFELHTLPVDAKAVADGDGITVYVDARHRTESANVPREVHESAIRRSKARAVKNYAEADALQKNIVDAGYRVINGPNNDDILVRKYRIRLRGIDAPESEMPFGKQAKEELVKLVQGKSLKVCIYDEDHYNRSVGDVYCNGTFVQEFMLKKGLAWHYVAHDQRPEFALWEKEARAARVGLWASSNPEKPWEWRKNRRNGV
ncbi:uncharacterized 38.1 kDa protein-like isoform X2 [Magnolia sinica]|uniref:uncharacterized 38.1 kDa protein-like isoform X2 n=1 Tax=Magnolia sinica TaxID=86752 RepID=UPI00265B33DC|nr:uncharacterized 38.1 kDa protein-like isoform X2 [Magnolia sinica]